jgi:phosphoglycerol transferase MdoB-like AlkP superfamily enzyme
VSGFGPDRFFDSRAEGLRFELASYITGLRDADKQLIRLLTFLISRKEPVICLFFGDHQPGFGLAFYNEMGRIKDGIERDYQMSTVPGLLWANRKGIVDPKDIPEQLSPVYLPAIVLHQMGIPLPGYMFYLQNGLSTYPVVHRNFVIDSTGKMLKFNEQRQDPYLRGLEVLNYDVLFGSRFSWQL